MPFPIPGRVAEALRRSTAAVRCGSGHAGSSGSAVVLTGDRVITNAHVVRSGALQIESWDGKRVPAKLLKLDRTRDLALLHADGLDAPASQLGDSERIGPGSVVIAVGNPLGFTGAVSSGVVHAVGVGQNRGLPLTGGLSWIYADIRLAPGNSGGPLANAQGQVIGINTMVVAGGLAMAIPSRAVQLFLTRTSRRGELGITARFVGLENGATGLLILELAQNSAAERASLLPGDVLIAANGRKLASFDDLESAVEEARGSVFRMHFIRAGERKIREVALELPAERVTHAA